MMMIVTMMMGMMTIVMTMMMMTVMMPFPMMITTCMTLLRNDSDNEEATVMMADLMADSYDMSNDLTFTN